MPSSDPTLRTRLRDETREAHEALDEFLSQLDLTAPSGLGTFLLAQQMPLEALEAAPSGRSGAAIRDLNA